MEITSKNGQKLIARNDNAEFREALRNSTIKVGDVVKSDYDLEVVAKFDGSNINEFYETRIQLEPYPVLFRRSVKQLSEQFGTDPSKGGVLLRKVGSNVFVFVPFDSSKD